MAKKGTGAMCPSNQQRMSSDARPGYQWPPCGPALAPGNLDLHEPGQGVTKVHMQDAPFPTPNDLTIWDSDRF